MAIGSPKFTVTFGPFAKTELFVGAGMGYHSNDARSATVTEVPGDPTTPEGASPLLVRSRGAEVGIRTKAMPNLDSSVSLFYLHQDSELFFDGDTGDTMPGLPSQRTGIEFTNDYRPVSWLHIDADLALSRARFLGFDATQAALYQSLAGYPQAQIGNAPGNFVYNAPWMVASAGITLGEKTGWFSALRWRYISSRPLTEDGVFQSPPLNHHQRRGGLPLRQRLEHPARRAQSAELDDRPCHLRLWFVAQERRAVRACAIPRAPSCRRRSARTA